LVGGSLGDLFGERRVFSIGVAGFGVVSLLCAIAPSIEFLIACRALQGAFGALLTPSALAVIVAAFPREERGGAIGSWTAWSGIATVIGPLAGGFLVDAVSWRLIFAVNVPFVVATLMLVSVAVPAREPGVAHAPIDWLGAALTFFGLAGPVLALIRQPVVGWSSPEVWAPALGGLALLATFVVHEQRTRSPMLPLGLFKRRNFAAGNVQTVAMYGGLSITFFLLVLFLQEVAGYRALSDAEESNAGIASGVNNAIARVAGLIAIAAVGAVISASFSSGLHQRLAGVRLSRQAQAALAQARGQTLARLQPARSGLTVADAVQSASVRASPAAV